MWLSSLLTQIIVCRDKKTMEWINDHFNHSMDLMNNVRRLSQVDWIRNGSFLWNERLKVPLAELITKRGMGFTFNAFDYKVIFKHLK